MRDIEGFPIGDVEDILELSDPPYYTAYPNPYIKEFNEILQEAQSKRKIKEVRKEALLHGLMKLYKEKDVEKIKFLGESLDRSIIDSDDDISAIIDWAMYN